MSCLYNSAFTNFCISFRVKEVTSHMFRHKSSTFYMPLPLTACSRLKHWTGWVQQNKYCNASVAGTRTLLLWSYLNSRLSSPSSTSSLLIVSIQLLIRPTSDAVCVWVPLIHLIAVLCQERRRPWYEVKRARLSVSVIFFA